MAKNGKSGIWKIIGDIEPSPRKAGKINGPKPPGNVQKGKLFFILCGSRVALYSLNPPVEKWAREGRLGRPRGCGSKAYLEGQGDLVSRLQP